MNKTYFIKSIFLVFVKFSPRLIAYGFYPVEIKPAGKICTIPVNRIPACSQILVNRQINLFTDRVENSYPYL